MLLDRSLSANRARHATLSVDVETNRRKGVSSIRLYRRARALATGARVVTSAQYLLDSESNLAEVMRAMMAQMNLSDVEEMGEH